MPFQRTFLIVIASAFVASSAWAVEGNAARGLSLFQACAACHSLQPNRNMTGPSLAGVWGREAGTVENVGRYSAALKNAHVRWDDKTLDEWIDEPQRLIPSNEMPFRGIKDAQQRADLLAYLKQATQPGAPSVREGSGGGMMGGMGGMMGGGEAPSPKHLDSEGRVQSIIYCKDTYTVATADGKTRKFWERNLRLKTDSSNDGPEKNAPALVPAGMMGDRADVIFANPDEINQFIKPQCE